MTGATSDLKTSKNHDLHIDLLLVNCGQAPRIVKDFERYLRSIPTRDKIGFAAGVEQRRDFIIALIQLDIQGDTLNRL